MTFMNASKMACITLLAYALVPRAAAAAAERNNFILLIPEAMQPANVNAADTPALARLREEGVNFTRSFAALPDLSHSAQPKTAGTRAADLAFRAYDTYASETVFDYAPSEASIRDTLDALTQKGRPFILVYRLNTLPTQALAPAKPLLSGNPGGEGAAGVLLLNTDRILSVMERKLNELGLFNPTNIAVIAEHGRSTVWKHSRSSYTGEMSFPGIPSDNLPPGFFAIDVLKALQLKDGSLRLYDPEKKDEPVRWWAGHYPSAGHATIGVLPHRPHVIIEARGGYDIIYLATTDKRRAARLGRYIVEHLRVQDYVSGTFVNEARLGRIGGALSLKYLGASEGEHGEQAPDIVVNFVSSVMRCGHPTICAVSIADSPVQEGLDMAEGFSRAETTTFMAARGPDFRVSFSSETPASPVDMVRTVEYLMGMTPPQGAKGDGRALPEVLRKFEGERAPRVRERVVSSKPTKLGDLVEARLVSVSGVNYLESAGGPGRTIGVPVRDPPFVWDWHWPWKTFEISLKP